MTQALRRHAAEVAAALPGHAAGNDPVFDRPCPVPPPEREEPLEPRPVTALQRPGCGALLRVGVVLSHLQPPF